MRITANNFSRLFLILPAALFLYGCTSAAGIGNGPRYSEIATTIKHPKDKALVFIYSHRLPWGRDFRVWENGRLVSSTMGYGKFFYFYAAPGRLHIASKMGGISGGAGTFALVSNEILRDVQGVKDRIVFTAAPGQTYYINMHTGFTRANMDLVTKQEGERKIKTCRLATPEGEI